MSTSDGQHDVARAFAMWRAMLPEHPDPTIDEFRAGYDAMFRDFPIDPDALITELDAGGVRSLQVQAGDYEPSRYVVYFHGGGLMCGNPEGVRSTAARVARAARATVLVPDYRLAPEHPYPAALDDATAACLSLPSRQDGEPVRMALLGDSAGGGLAISCAIRLHDNGHDQLAALAVWSPWVDMTVSGATIESKATVDPIASGQSLTMSATAYLQGHAPTDPTVSPLFADLSGLPPLMIEVGTEEVLLDDARRLAAKAQDDGVEVTLTVADGLPHVYQYFASFLPAAQTSIERTGAFIDKHA
ncbi:alpha/beta hydrolase [Mycolicibacterium pulveris]|nr:alpha/beta hydrolase [Mycolicibacterium pulveris]MCV6983208.1 alpha/beta hydrolase [Mycolicibacterium pulveris]